MPNRRQPSGSEIFLDHIGHFVGDIGTAGAALALAGFQTTPSSIQQHTNPDGTTSQTGTGNITVMLDQGYLEILFKTADTPLGQEFDAALSAYPGVHLAAFAAADARIQSTRLQHEGFLTQPVVDLRRPIGTENGVAEAAFSVARVKHGEMPEGRMQFLTHHTEETLWQPRWLKHPNGAKALRDVVIAVENVGNAAKRFGRFLAHKGRPNANGTLIALERGGVQLMNAKAFEAMFGPVPRLPFVGAYAVEVASVSATDELLRKHKIARSRLGNALKVPFPTSLGLGTWLFVERERSLPWRNS
jgi:hypothetical protein